MKLRGLIFARHTVVCTKYETVYLVTCFGKLVFDISRKTCAFVQNVGVTDHVDCRGLRGIRETRA